MRIDQWRSHAAAIRFHLGHSDDRPVLTAILGGTGTGKSTVMNRLFGLEVSAASFRRTFTCGPVAVAARDGAVPEGWLGLRRRTAGADALPVRGEPGSLLVVLHDNPLSARVTLVDTPDLDGDQPIHHAEADRVFRWAEAVVFLVTPEKYQMTEWQGYARLARRYRLPALFVMNKAEDALVFEDLRSQLGERDWPDARVFAIPRDDAAYEPPPEAHLAGLREAALALERPEPAQRDQGLANRGMDLVSRLRDQILGPLSADRAEIEQLLAAMRAMTVPAPGVDVSPLTASLQRHMQEQSVLYLMGPKRVLDRVRQVPGLLSRLPRTAWDLLAGSRPGTPTLSQPADSTETAVPDFARLLTDQLIVVQSRIDDILRSSTRAAEWIEAEGSAYPNARIDPAQAGRIAEEELAEFRAWLEERGDARPRDTRVVEKLLKHLPGGRKACKLSEVAPYLLAVVVAAHGAFFGPIDLLILGGFSLTVWLGEKLSNEVTARTRRTNARIGERFDRLACEQVDRACRWLDQQAPAGEDLLRIERLSDAIARHVKD